MHEMALKQRKQYKGQRPETLRRNYERDRWRFEMRKREADGRYICPFCGFGKLSMMRLRAAQRWGACWVCKMMRQLEAKYGAWMLEDEAQH